MTQMVICQIHTHMRPRTHAHTHTTPYAHTFTQGGTFTRVHAYTHAQVHSHMHTHAHIHAHVHAHALHGGGQGAGQGVGHGVWHGIHCITGKAIVPFSVMDAVPARSPVRWSKSVISKHTSPFFAICSYFLVLRLVDLPAARRVFATALFNNHLFVIL